MILVNKNQELNPVVKAFSNQPWQWADTNVTVDYVLANGTGVLFLSLKYHRLHPNYIYERLSAAKQPFRLKIILLCLDDWNGRTAEATIREITRAGLVSEWTVLLAWGTDEAARWLETLHSQHKRSTAVIRERGSEAVFLRELGGLNKSDCDRLMDYLGGQLGRLGDITSPDQLLSIKGLGKRKADAIFRWLDADFKDFR